MLARKGGRGEGQRAAGEGGQGKQGKAAGQGAGQGQRAAGQGGFWGGGFLVLTNHPSVRENPYASTASS